MTEERKQYLKSIGKEERAIRLELRIQKNRIQYLKELIKHPITMDDKRTMLRLMWDTRFIIKLLKKQLPAPVQCMSNKFIVKTFCVVCKGKVCDEENYCPRCGQKLR